MTCRLAHAWTATTPNEPHALHGFRTPSTDVVALPLFVTAALERLRLPSAGTMSPDKSMKSLSRLLCSFAG
jgi:hypothetical protein